MDCGFVRLLLAWFGLYLDISFVACGLCVRHTLTIDFVVCGCLPIWFSVIYVRCSFGVCISRVDGLCLWGAAVVRFAGGLGFVFGWCLL